MKRFLLAIVVIITLLSPFIGTKQAHANQGSPLAQNEYEHRYVIFLQGITSSSTDPAHPLDDSFKVIEGALREEGLNKIVYFSYAVATAINRGELMCAAWADPACDIEPGQELGDLSSLHLSPEYSAEDTKIDIDKQADALEWLAGQIVKQDAEAEIDLLGFSLGGIIATRWASRPSGSEYYDHIHGIVTMGSPLGGIPLANAFSSGCDLVDIRCIVAKKILLSKYGDAVGAQLQVPQENPEESILDDIRDNFDTKRFNYVSIQSTDDYTVNNKLFPLCSTLACINGRYDNVLIGIGTQYWDPRTYTKHHDDSLGGLGIPTEPIYHANLDDWLGENHSATLKHPFTAQWILEMVLSPSQNVAIPPTVTPSPTQEIPHELHDASNAGFAYDIVQSGETALLVFDVLNSGQTVWSSQEFQFSPVTDDDSINLASVAVIGTVNPSESIIFEIDVPDVSGISVITIEYQMTYMGEPFGDVIKGYIFILPDQIKDIEDEIRKKIDELVQQGEQEVNNLVDRILEEIQKAIEREARQALEEMLRQCLGANSIVVTGAVLVYFQRKFRYRK